MSDQVSSGWDAVRPADAEARYETGQSESRTELVRGLRDLAALLEDRPEIPVPVHGYMPLNVFATGTDRAKLAQVDHAATLLEGGVVDDTLDGGHYLTSRSFGIVQYRFVAIPSSPASSGFAVGQDVQLTPEAAREQARQGRALAGVVVAGPDEQGEARYTIRFPGWNAAVRMHASALEPAATLGPVQISGSSVTSIDAAENALVNTAVRLRAALRSGQDGAEDDERDLIKLSSALGRACGLSEHELIRQLDPWISARTAEYMMTGTAATAGHAVRVAADDLARDTKAEPAPEGPRTFSRPETGIRDGAAQPKARR